MPSVQSSEAKHFICCSTSRSSARSSSARPAPNSTRFKARTASGGPAASCAASDCASASTLSCGTMRSTTPMRSASAAPIMSPVHSIHAARDSPARRGSRYVPPKSGNNPTFAKFWPNMAWSLAMRISQPSATFIPAPAAGPFTAATTGFSIVHSATIKRAPLRNSGSSSWPRPASRYSRIVARSPPEQNARPAPVTITARTAGFAAARSTPSASARPSCGSSAFSRSGRFMHSVRTPPSSVSTSTGAAPTAASLTPCSLGLGRLRRGMAVHQRSQLAEVMEFVGLRFRGVLPARGRQHVHLRAVQLLFLHAQLHRPAGELLKHQLAVERDHARRVLLQLLPQHHAALGKILAADLFNSPRRTLYQVRQPDAEIEHAPVVLRLQRLRDQARLVHQRPKAVPAPRVVMPRARRSLAWVKPHQDHLQPILEVIRQPSH